MLLLQLYSFSDIFASQTGIFMNYFSADDSEQIRIQRECAAVVIPPHCIRLSFILQKPTLAPGGRRGMFCASVT
jgi:hypothetical protein